MDLRAKVNTSLKEALKSKDRNRLSTLRLINAAIKDREISARTGEEGANECVSDDELMGILSKMVRQRQESARAYEEGGRLDLAEREQAEVEVIEEFLPRQLDEAETEAAVNDAISETGASSIRDMGKVMGHLKSRHAGRINFGKVGPMVKDRLSA